MSKFQIEKDYHRRKLAIIEMIDRCEEMILREANSIERFRENRLINPILNSQKNMIRFEKIRSYLIERYNR